MNNSPVDNSGYVSGTASGTSSLREPAQTGLEVTLPTMDHTPVQVEEVVHSRGRTLDELHPITNSAPSPPTFRHHEVDNISMDFSRLSLSVTSSVTLENQCSKLCDAIRNADNVESLDADTIKQFNDIEVINGKDDQGYTPLYTATVMGKHDFLKCLLQRGARPDEKIPSIGNATALVVAILNDDAKSLACLLEYGAKPNQFFPRSRNTVLAEAIVRGHVAMLAPLLKAGADPEYAHKYQAGSSALDITLSAIAIAKVSGKPATL